MNNQYNAFCLADDMMEPYRPFVDHIVYTLYTKGSLQEQLATNERTALAKVLLMDCLWEGQQTTVGLALQRTAASLARCFDTQMAIHLTFPTYAF